MQTIAQALEKLDRSDFRARFRLKAGDIAYIRRIGPEKLEQHCRDFIAQRLAPAQPENDGKQTPMRGHPVFIAQHACACCCRGCLEKWYRIPQGGELTPSQQEKIVRLLLAWIEREIQRGNRQ